MPVLTDLIGTPFDQMKCWDLVREVYSRLGRELPAYRDFLKQGEPMPGEYFEPIREPVKYCLCIYALRSSHVDHAAVYLGENKIIHATDTSGVVIDRYTKYYPRLRGMYRWKGGAL